MRARFFKGPAELRRWMQKNHDTATELLIGFFRKESGKGGITYPEALDEALCFGWIDGVRKRFDEVSYTIRFTARSRRSIWSAVNIKRAGELVEAGRMAPAGLRAFERRDAQRANRYSYERRSVVLEAAYLKEFERNKTAWAFFEAQPPYYRRMVSWYVMSAKKAETRQRRLAGVIEDSQYKRRLKGLEGSKTRMGVRGT